MHTFLSTTLLLACAILGTLAHPLSSVHNARFFRPRPNILAADSPSPSLGLINTTLGTCLPSGNSSTIQALLAGPGSHAVLCPNSTFPLYAPVNFTAPNQVLTTLGAPTDASRATLVIMANFTAAIAGACDACSGAVLSHVQLNGNRAQLGRPPGGGSGLVEMGGNTAGQRVEFVRSFDPRGFSCLHIIEGGGMSCRNATVANNDIGPCGVSAETDFPVPATNGSGRSFATGVPGTISSSQTSGKWADGISMACPYSLVTNNTITDASDGGIVIFGAFGSTVTFNHVLALNQTLLGGINLVDSAPSSNYTDVLVANNTIEARGRMIKVAIGCGPAVWGDDLVTRNYGASVRGNTLAGANMGYGVLLSGVANWTVSDNVAAPDAVFGAAYTESCHGLGVDPAAVVMDPSTVDSSDVQSGSFGPAQFAICVESNTFVEDEEDGDDDDGDDDDDDGGDDGSDDGDDGDEGAPDCPPAGNNSTGTSMTTNSTQTSMPTQTQHHNHTRVTSTILQTITVSIQQSASVAANSSVSSASSNSSGSSSLTLPSGDVGYPMGGPTMSGAPTQTQSSSSAYSMSTPIGSMSLPTGSGATSASALFISLSSADDVGYPMGGVNTDSAVSGSSTPQSQSSSSTSTTASPAFSFPPVLPQPLTPTRTSISLSLSTVTSFVTVTEVGPGPLAITPSSTTSSAGTGTGAGAGAGVAAPTFSLPPGTFLEDAVEAVVAVPAASATAAGVGGKKPCPHPSHHKTHSRSLVRRWAEALGEWGW